MYSSNAVIRLDFRYFITILHNIAGLECFLSKHQRVPESHITTLEEIGHPFSLFGPSIGLRFAVMICRLALFSIFYQISLCPAVLHLAVPCPLPSRPSLSALLRLAPGVNQQLYLQRARRLTSFLLFSVCNLVLVQVSFLLLGRFERLGFAAFP